MLDIKLSKEQIENEIERIVNFLAERTYDTKKVVIGASGGLDSDVVARLAAKIPSLKKLKLLIIAQEGLEQKYYFNAQNLSYDIGAPLITVDLKNLPLPFMQALQKADSDEHFRPDGLLDLSRAKCSLRTPVFSTYQDRGYIVLGTSNRTEKELGFFLPFGDGLAHVKPIVHLYKTQVYQLAKYLGTREEVLNQPPSSGFWEGANDLEDISYWLFNEAPIQEEINFDKNAELEVAKIGNSLTFERLDTALFCISKGVDYSSTAQVSGLPIDIVMRLNKLRDAAQILKNREINVYLDYI